MYEIHVSGRMNFVRFDRLSSADAYRRAMLAAGRFAWLVVNPNES